MSAGDKLARELERELEDELKPNKSNAENLKALMSFEVRFFSTHPDLDGKCWRKFWSQWGEILKDADLNEIVADDTETHDGTERKDYTCSTLLHFASRLGAHRSLGYMLDAVKFDRTMTLEEKSKLIDRATHRCTSKCTAEQHATDDETKGGTAFLVRLTLNVLLHYFLFALRLYSQYSVRRGIRTHKMFGKTHRTRCGHKIPRWL